jgi:hypothetical protein
MFKGNEYRLKNWPVVLAFYCSTYIKNSLSLLYSLATAKIARALFKLDILGARWMC